MSATTEWRHKLKENDPAAYAMFLANEAERKRKWRANLTEDQRAKRREQVNARSRKRRALLKEKGEKEKRTAPKKQTRHERQILRVKWRDAKRKYRENLHPQKRRRIREKDKASKAALVEEKTAKKEERRKKRTEQLLMAGTAFKTKEAERKAVYRAQNRLPRDPCKFAIVLARLLQRCERCP